MVLSYAYKGTIACLYWDVPGLFFCSWIAWIPLQWHHNEHDCISNHQPHDFLLNSLFRRRSKKHQSSASLAFVWGIHRGLVNSPHKGLVTRKMFPFDDFIMIRCYNNAVQYNLILYTVLLCLRQNQRPICVCAQPMRDNVTLQHHLSLAGCIHKIIPENINFNLNSLKHAILHLYREL